jgi:hypothetical protein
LARQKIALRRRAIPFARFDKEHTKQGLECLRSYRTEWDEKARAFKKTPDLRIPRQSGQGLNEPAPSEQQEDRCGETSRLRGCDGHIHPSQDRRPRWLRRALFASA